MASSELLVYGSFCLSDDTEQNPDLRCLNIPSISDGYSFVLTTLHHSGNISISSHGYSCFSETRPLLSETPSVISIGYILPSSLSLSLVRVGCMVEVEVSLFLGIGLFPSTYIFHPQMHVHVGPYFEFFCRNSQRYGNIYCQLAFVNIHRPLSLPIPGFLIEFQN